MKTAVFKTKTGDLAVSRDAVLGGMTKFDLNYRGKEPDTGQGWFVLENDKRYPPKRIMSLATDVPRGGFRSAGARSTLQALGFDLMEVEDDAVDGVDLEQAEAAVKTTFGIERDLQTALRSHIDQLEPELRITDGGKEQTVESGRIDITAEDGNRATVVIELKAGEADRDAIGQILAYMGDLSGSKKAIRGILVAGGFSARAVAAASVVPSLQLKKYSFNFAFESVKK